MSRFQSSNVQALLVCAFLFSAPAYADELSIYCAESARSELSHFGSTPDSGRWEHHSQPRGVAYLSLKVVLAGSAGTVVVTSQADGPRAPGPFVTEYEVVTLASDEQELVAFGSALEDGSRKQVTLLYNRKMNRLVMSTLYAGVHGHSTVSESYGFDCSRR